MSDEIGWQQKAACRNAPADLWYQEGYETHLDRVDREQLALAYCRTCPVVALCYEAFRDDPWAVAGATTPAMRGFRGNSCAKCDAPHAGLTSGLCRRCWLEQQREAAS